MTGGVGCNIPLAAASALDLSHGIADLMHLAIDLNLGDADTRRHRLTLFFWLDITLGAALTAQSFEDRSKIAPAAHFFDRGGWFVAFLAPLLVGFVNDWRNSLVR